MTRSLRSSLAPAAPIAVSRGARRPLRRRGSIYAMVLGITMLITVIGIAALATSRVTARAASESTHWQEAGSLAFSAVEQAVGQLNAEGALAPDTWRNGYTSGQTGFTTSIKDGRMSWSLVDEGDGLIADDYADPIKIYGIGEVGRVRRVYSARLVPAGAGMDVLRTAFHAAGAVQVGGATTVINGPLSTNGDLTFSGGSLKGNGGSEVAGAGGATVAPAKPMPSPGVFDIYRDRATPIDSSVAAGGSIQPSPLNAQYSPYGAANPEGIYYLRLPGTITMLQVLSSRIKGTLVIEAAANTNSQELEILGASFWEPHNQRYPTLLVRGFQKVRIYGSMSPFSDSSGTYPSEIRGVVHLIGAAEVLLGDATYMDGCLIADGRITTNGTVAITADPDLLLNPPLGYRIGDRVALVPGSWKWDAPPGQ